MEEETRNTRRRTSKRTKRERPAQEIQYTQPRPFFRKKLIMQLLTMAAVVLAVSIGVSVFFKVDTVTVTGAEKYSALTVKNASDIQTGDSLLFFGRGEAAKRIKTQLPYVSTVRFEVKLPGTVNIIIEEKTVSYAVEDTQGTWWCLTSDGMVVEKQKKNATGASVITGVKLLSPKIGEQAVAAEAQNSTETATQAERLQAAVKILLQLETTELFENVTKIDVSDLFALKLYCGETYLVELGDGNSLETKLLLIRSVLNDSTRPANGVFQLFYEDGAWQVQYNPWG